ncbi:MAG: helix-hairpin-helix domain-containing protein [Candidatus Pacearchaeota archaeon]
MGKKNKIFFIEIFFLIFIIGSVVAECSDSQIDINSASLEELQGITQIGEGRAEAIISLRPFNSVDDLSRVSGIGNGKRLEQIKTEGLACVKDEIVEEDSEGEEDEDNEEDAEENDEEDETEKKAEESSVKIESSDGETAENVDLKPIVLNAQSIKSENDKEFSTKNLAFYGVIFFCVVFGALFFLKKRKYKNEFQ